VNEELTARVACMAGLVPDTDFALAVVGLRLKSEHDDDCCVTVELGIGGCSVSRSPSGGGGGGVGGGGSGGSGGGRDARKAAVREALLGADAAAALSKGARVDRLRFGAIPRNFKGSVLTKDLAAAWTAAGGADDP